MSQRQLNLPPVPVQSVSPTRESAAPEIGKGVSRAEERPLTLWLAEAVEATGCSEKEAALLQGYEPAYWSRIKAGEKHAHLERVARLPEAVQRAFVERWARQLKMRVSLDDAKAKAIADLAKAAVQALSEIA